MAQDVEFGRGAIGKVRNFWVCTGLAIITLGVYYYFWYYLVNDEQKDIGIAKDDPNLASASPMMSVIAVLVGWIILIPPLISVYNFGVRIKRAQRLVGIELSETINPVLAFVLYFPGGILIVPLFFHYWYVTKHQNSAVRAAGGLSPWGDAVPVADAGLPVG